ncbi:alpha/beta hydrolase [Acidipila sp. EB88]|uniref:alpha/beta hydrolase n=1 Tax=Acidipila sp. EB88 TaxID=2305226 RepID=UPI000F5E5B2E|nr:alpha/beta hydrolase [Acidipila sp. EB88]RRA49545.1 alpha/beta hydrolase [Acidipila sp. EB88]
MKTVLILFVVFAARVLAAQGVWQPSPGHAQIRIWPGTAPDAQPVAKPEMQDTKAAVVAGRPMVAIGYVSQPTMTVYAPKANNAGAAVVVFPGGGYWVLAIDLEGTEVCDWLTSRGITCVLLKYRVPGSQQSPRSGPYPRSPMALEDAQRTIGLVRFHAAEWHIDPHRIGVLGFSAGGHLVAATSVHFNRRIYARVDAADDVSCRPDFAVALYPGHLFTKANTLGLNADIASRVSAQTPPTFLLQNENDDVDSIWDAMSYEAALIKAHVPVEFHSYAEGGHAFGLRRTRYQATAWPQLVEAWLRTLGVIAR